jgi:hypothetical protein
MNRAILDPTVFEEWVRSLTPQMQEKVCAYPPDMPYRYDRGQAVAARGEARFDKAWIQKFEEMADGSCSTVSLIVLYAENPGRRKATDGDGLALYNVPFTALSPWEPM